MSEEQTEQERRAGAIEELRRRVIARHGASKIPAEIDALKFGDSSLTPAQREIISRIPVALSPMNMHQKMSEAEAEIGRLTAERDAARAELAELRDVVKRETLNLEYLANWFDLDPDYRTRLERLRDAVETIRAAIGIDSEVQP